MYQQSVYIVSLLIVTHDMVIKHYGHGKVRCHLLLQGP